MSMRLRKWTWRGKKEQAWIVDYRGQDNKRHLMTFRNKRDARTFLKQVEETRINRRIKLIDEAAWRRAITQRLDHIERLLK